MNIELLEAFMLVCWGASWPFSIAKVIRTRSVEGKSTLFLILILCGYAAAITAQFIRGLTPVILLYSINATMIFTDLCLVLYFQRGKKRFSLLRQYIRNTIWTAERQAGRDGYHECTLKQMVLCKKIEK